MGKKEGRSKVSMTHFVYVIQCADNTLYTGYTTDIEKRLAEHNGEDKTASVRSAGAKYTRGRRPVKLVHQEEFKTRSEAMQREYAIKQLTKSEKQSLFKK